MFLTQGKSPEENVGTIINLLGGIDELIQPDDVIVIKLNSQWWNQGATNTNALKGFIDHVLKRTDFAGEIILADNHHYKEDISRGWNSEHRNGNFSYLELIDFYRKAGFENISDYQWHDVGPNPQPREGNAVGSGKWVNHPDDGDGYVWLENNVYISPEGRKCMMTYPIFTSKITGCKIDLMRGIYENGTFNRNKLKLVNFSCLNHHSDYCGVTASVKNLMGIVDMSCGYHGSKPEGFYNTHFIGHESAFWRYSIYLNYYHRKYGFGKTLANILGEFGSFHFHYTGGALGHWIVNVCKPDLNIVEAEWVGWGSRIDLDKRYQAKTILASVDPVALDYISAKEILFPATKKSTDDEYYINLNNPDNKEGPFYKFLLEAYKVGVGNLEPNKIRVHTS